MLYTNGVDLRLRFGMVPIMFMMVPQSRTSRQKLAAFTLVEIMIVVVIIGLLAAIAIPAFKRLQVASQNTRTINDFRIFSQAFEVFYTTNGDWPPNSLAGVIPTGMTGDFNAAIWQAPTVLGGSWNWDYNRFGFTAGISINGFTCPTEQMAEIDAKIDDGDLATGKFQLVTGARVMMILEN